MGNAGSSKKGDSAENVKEFLETAKEEFEEKMEKSSQKYRLLRRFRPVKNLGHGLIWPSHVGTAQRKEKLLCYENIGQAKSCQIEAS